MVNQQEERTRRGEPKDEVWVFQPKAARAWTERAADFRPAQEAQRPICRRMDPLTREETETLEMLYRHQREFAVGHGISVTQRWPNHWQNGCPGRDRMGADVRSSTADSSLRR